MNLARPAIALDPKSFGRGRRRELASPQPISAAGSADDLKLFALTFVAGFMFVSILIG